MTSPVEWRIERCNGVPICPVVRCQADGSCGVHATVNSQESRNRIQLTLPASSQSDIDKAKTMVLSPRYAVDKMSDMAGGKDKTNFGSVKAAQFLKTTGTILSRSYADVNENLSLVDPGVEHFKLVSWRRLKGKDRIQKAEEALKDGPIVGSFEITTDFRKLKKGEVYTASGEKKIRTSPGGVPVYSRHSVCVTGSSEIGEDGDFSVLNNWGKKWCDSGFGRIKKTVFDKFLVPVVPSGGPERQCLKRKRDDGADEA